MTAGQKAGATRIYNRKLNERYGFKDPVLSRDMFEDYINLYNPQNLTRTLLENPLLSEQQMAKVAGKDVGTIRRFLPTAIQSVIKKKPCVGNFKLNIPELLKIRNKQRNNGVERRGRKPSRKLKSFNGEVKKILHNRLLGLIRNKRSPKNGVIATLPFDFVLEKRIIKHKDLNGLVFHGYEFGKDQIRAAKSRIQFKRQKKILRDDTQLANRVVMYNHDINDALLKENESDRYAHILVDYCGMYSTNKDAILHIIKNNLVKVGGLVWITLCGRAKRGDSAKKNLPKLIESAGGNRYKAHNIEGEKLFPYFTSQSMFTTILRRIK
jgi:hypothetical protein